MQGEAGIGKSSVVRLCARRWYDMGATVMYGQCDQDSIDPYRPFIEALRTLAAAVPAARMRALTDENATVLGLFLPDLAGADTPAPMVTDQLTVLEGVRAFLEGLSHEAPCVLVLEDLGWSDASSLALLRYIARVGAGRLLVVATMRLDGHGNDHSVRSTVSELHRTGILECIALDGLSLDEVRDLVRGLAGLAPRCSSTSSTARPTATRSSSVTHSVSSSRPTRSAINSGARSSATVWPRVRTSSSS